MVKLLQFFNSEISHYYQTIKEKEIELWDKVTAVYCIYSGPNTLELHIFMNNQIIFDLNIYYFMEERAKI